MELYGYGASDTTRNFAGIFVNGLLTKSGVDGLTVATLTHTDESCTVGNIYDTFATTGAAGKTAFYDLMMGFPSGTIVLGVTRSTAVGQWQNLNAFQDIDDAYGTQFVDLGFKGTTIFIVIKDDPSAAIVHLSSSARGPLQYAEEYKPFIKG